MGRCISFTGQLDGGIVAWVDVPASLLFEPFKTPQIIFCLGLFVIVSWISFLIPMDVIPGRMALLVTLFLVLVNIFNTVTTNTPKVRLL